MDVAQRLQHAGVPAAPMYRAADVLTDPQLAVRGLYTEMVHPMFDRPMLVETHPAPYRRIPDADLRPAPMPGEQTLEICHKLLGLHAHETDRLIAQGVLFSWTEHDQGGTP
jgi:crotonobetainyl-CoA:carnitine CoA-transferase CaiB-like acyl-CoA transferase